MKVHGEIEHVAPVVRHTFESMRICKQAEPHRARDAAYVVSDETYAVQCVVFDVLGKVCDGEDELADVQWDIKLRGEPDQTFLVAGANRIFEEDVFEFIEQST